MLKSAKKLQMAIVFFARPISAYLNIMITIFNLPKEQLFLQKQAFSSMKIAFSPDFKYLLAG